MEERHRALNANPNRRKDTALDPTENAHAQPDATLDDQREGHLEMPRKGATNGDRSRENTTGRQPNHANQIWELSSLTSTPRTTTATTVFEYRTIRRYHNWSWYDYHDYYNHYERHYYHDGQHQEGPEETTN